MRVLKLAAEVEVTWAVQKHPSNCDAFCERRCYCIRTGEIKIKDGVWTFSYYHNYCPEEHDKLTPAKSMVNQRGRKLILKLASYTNESVPSISKGELKVEMWRYSDEKSVRLQFVRNPELWTTMFLDPAALVVFRCWLEDADIPVR